MGHWDTHFQRHWQAGTVPSGVPCRVGYPTGAGYRAGYDTMQGRKQRTAPAGLASGLPYRRGSTEPPPAGKPMGAVQSELQTITPGEHAYEIARYMSYALRPCNRQGGP
jgi:hypothetical protein